MEHEDKKPPSWRIHVEFKNEKSVKVVDWNLEMIEIKFEDGGPRASKWEGTAPWQKTIEEQAGWSSHDPSSPFFKVNTNDGNDRGARNAGANDIFPSSLFQVSSAPSTPRDYVNEENVKIDGGLVDRGRSQEPRDIECHADTRPRVSLTEGTLEVKFNERQKLPLGLTGSPRNSQSLAQSIISTINTSVRKTVRRKTPSPGRRVHNVEKGSRSDASDGNLSPSPATINSTLKDYDTLESVSLNQISHNGRRFSSRDSSPASSENGVAITRTSTEPFSKFGKLRNNEPSGWASGALVRKVSGSHVLPKVAAVFSSYANAVKKDITKAEILNANMRRVNHSPTREEREMLVGSVKKIALKPDSRAAKGPDDTEQNKDTPKVEKHLDTNTDPFKLEGFRPSSMSQEKAGLIERPSGHKYLGNLDSLSAALQIQDLPAEENCALWITHISPDVDIAALLAMVRTGAVFALLLSEPQEDHWSKAAKLVFMKHDSAAKFLDQINSYDGVVICGVRINAIWNRNGYCENTAKKSRVIHITGPKSLMTFAKWTAYFSKCVCFELETWRNLPEGNRHKKKMEFRFSRIDGQAEAIYQAIFRNPRLDSVEVKYAPDPCDPESILR